MNIVSDQKNWYEVDLKWIHILSAVLMFGAGAGSAFSLYRANRAGDFHRLMAEKSF